MHSFYGILSYHSCKLVFYRACHTYRIKRTQTQTEHTRATINIMSSFYSVNGRGEIMNYCTKIVPIHCRWNKGFWEYQYITRLFFLIKRPVKMFALRVPLHFETRLKMSKDDRVTCICRGLSNVKFSHSEQIQQTCDFFNIFLKILIIEYNRLIQSRFRCKKSYKMFYLASLAPAAWIDVAIQPDSGRTPCIN